MKVYVVTSWLAYEGEEVVAVHATLEGALAAFPNACFMQERCLTCGGIFDDCDCEGSEEELGRHINRLRRRGSGHDIDEWDVAT